MQNLTPTSKGEVAIYQPDNSIHLEVLTDQETVWLTQAQIAELFGTKRPAITKHLNNIYNSGELEKSNTCSILEHMGNNDLQTYHTAYYNLLSVGYRVNSKNATQFRIWASKILKDYLLKGYSINNRMNRIEDNMEVLKKKVTEIDLQINTQLTPTQGIFFDGQIFDAYAFASDLIKSAKKSIILMDNYVDESVLLLLSKRKKNVSAKILTANFNQTLKQDLSKHNTQYPAIKIEKFIKSHDRFLIIDDTEIFHIGASLKDLGKKWFAFSKMKQSPLQ